MEQIVCFQKNGIKRSFVSARELLEYRKSLQERFCVLQLYKNLQKGFNPFVYTVIIDQSAPERIKYWKEAIQKNADLSPLMEEEEVYKDEIMKTLKVLIRMIEIVSKRKVKCIQANFVICNKGALEAWLVDCDSIILEHISAVFMKTFDQAYENDLFTSMIKATPYHKRRQKTLLAIASKPACLRLEGYSKKHNHTFSTYSIKHKPSDSNKKPIAALYRILLLYDSKE